MSNRFTGFVVRRLKLEGWIDPKAHARLLARIKELEGERDEARNTIRDWIKENQPSGWIGQLRTQLHQRDTALVAAREALQVFVSGATKIDLKQTHKAIAQIDRALSQIRECK